MKLERRSCKRGRVEIIPMIDTILILLIFYMSFSTFTAPEQWMEAALPPHGPGGQPEWDVVLHVRNDGEILVDATVFDLESLRASLEGLRAAPVPTRVIIEGEADTQYQAIINVMDACAQAGLTRVGFRPLAL